MDDICKDKRLTTNFTIIMWYYKEKDENGQFEDKDGVRYSLTECYRVIAPDGRKNAELGYTEFENMKECLTTWQLEMIEER